MPDESREMDPTDPEIEFDNLIRRARDGDSRAVERLVQLYEPEVRTVVRFRLGAALRPYLDSVDILQSVHKSLMMGLQRGRFDVSDAKKLIALARTIVRRKIARKWRKLRRQQRIQGNQPSTAVPDLLASLTSNEQDPAELAEVHSTVQKIFESLNSHEQHVIEMRLEGYTTVEIARELKVDPDVLRVQLSRLRKKLRSRDGFLDVL